MSKKRNRYKCLLYILIGAQNFRAVRLFIIFLMSSSIAGVDLGTSTSCISIFKNGNIEVVAAKSGERVFPSVVSFRDSGIIFGKDAKKQLSLYPQQTVFEIKRLIGHKFSDECVQQDIQSWPFKVVPNADDRPQIVIRYNNQDHYLTPEQVSGFIILRLIEEAERVSDSKITDIVVTVPAYFNDNQRRATSDAATSVGLNVLGILNEPTAAAIAYGIRNDEKDKTILVYDLGGGTFDVTILEIKEDEYSVIATDGDTHLGGVDLDQILEQMIYNSISPNTGSQVDWNDSRTLALLRKTAQEVKIQLSTMDSVEGGLFNQSFTIWRSAFERESNQFFAKTMSIVDKILTNAGKRYEDIDDVVLVGGSSRIPCIKTFLEQKFGSGKVSYRINPDEAVSMGALIRARQLYSNKVPSNISPSSPLAGDPLDIDDIGFTVVDVVPLSLGLKNAQGLMAVLIPRYSHFGDPFTRTFTTNHDNATSMKIRVYQGERTMAADNLEIGSFRLTGIPQMKRGMACVDVTFSTDQNGILTVSAVVCDVDPVTGEIRTDEQGNHLYLPNSKMTVTFDNKSTNLSPDEVARMMKEVQEMKNYDMMKRRCASIKNDIRERMYLLEDYIMEHGPDMEPQQESDLQDLFGKVKKLIKDNMAEENQLQSYNDILGQWIESLGIQ